MNDFCTSFLDHLHIDNGQKYRVCIKNNMMLIFDEKMMIFEAFLGPNIFRKRVFYMFFVVFFDLKIVSDVIDSKNMNCDLGTDFFVKKMIFFLLMKKTCERKDPW